MEAEIMKAAYQGAATEPEITKEMLDAIYRERDQCVAYICKLAIRLGLTCGLKESGDPEYPLVFIDSAKGQLSWHIKREELAFFPKLRPFKPEWDGHTPEQKYQRMLAL